MIESREAIWIVVALLAPFWWGLGLLLLAFLSTFSPSLRGRLGRLFDRLDATPIPR